MRSLQDKVIIVTGAGQGLGKEYAFALADEGAKVVIAEIQSEKAERERIEVALPGR